MKMEKVPTVTAQERRVMAVKGKPVFYDSPRIKSAKALLVAHLKQYRPPKPYDSGVRLRVSRLFPKGRHKDGEYRITKPDTDNLQNAQRLYDALRILTRRCLQITRLLQRLKKLQPQEIITNHSLKPHRRHSKSKG